MGEEVGPGRREAGGAAAREEGGGGGEGGGRGRAQVGRGVAED